MRVVVTGGAGFVGSHLCRELLARGDEVVAIDNLVTGSLRNLDDLFGHPAFTFQHHNVSNFVHVPGPVDAILHFASPASPADFDRIPIQILKVGSLGTHNTLGLAKDKGARYLLASTSEVYGDPLVHPQVETYWGNVNPIGPRGVYDEAKRFAEAMTMAYHRHHGLDVRIVRIFNSVLADEQVLYDDGTQLRREAIGALAARLGAPSADLDGYAVPAFDGTGAIHPSPATTIVGHPPTGACFELHTGFGRRVRVTGDHSVFVPGPDGRPLARPVRQLAVGDRIAICGRIDVRVRDRTAISVAEAWTAAGNDPWALDIRAAEFGTLAYDHRLALAAGFRSNGGIRAKDRRRAAWAKVTSCIERRKMPLGAIRHLGITIPDEATVRLHAAGRPPELPETIPLTDDVLWLLGLYVAGGRRFGSAKSSFVTISGEPASLERATKTFERDIGLSVERGAATPFRKSAIFVHSRLLLVLLDHLGFGAGPKAIPGWVLALPLARLKWFLDGFREGNGAPHLAAVSEALKDDLVVALGRFGVVPRVERCEPAAKARAGERRYSFWRLTLPGVEPASPLEWDRGVHQDLDAPRWGDLVWDSLTSMAEVPPTPLVYDFCVPGKENFWAGGVACHNTYGPHMRPDDGRSVSNFLVQALAGKPLTVYGDGSQTRSFCYVDDEVRGILALLGSDYVGPVNIGNPNEYTILQLAETVLEVTGSSSEIRYEPLPVDDPAQRKPDITLARSLFAWEPAVDLRTGLARTAEWFRRG